MDRPPLGPDDPSDGEWIDTTDDEVESEDEWHTSDEEFIDDDSSDEEYIDSDWEVEPVVLNVQVGLRPKRRQL